MSLPDPWVDRIFEKLTLVYGVDFMNRWKGLTIADVKTDWGHELAGFAQRPAAIAHALQNLPATKPPTVLEFKAIARTAPAPIAEVLPEPPVDPDRLRAELAKLAQIRRETDQQKDPKEWAHKLVAKHQAGHRVPGICLRFAHEALRRTGVPA